MNYKEESYDQVIKEIVPLLHKNYTEVHKYQDIKFNPSLEAYKKLEEAGILKIYTCRLDSGELIGYSLFIIHNHLHFKDKLVAMNDILFMEESHRGRGLRFLMWCNDRLEELGVDIVMQNVNAEHDFGMALERFGYELMEYVYTRRVKNGN